MGIFVNYCAGASRDVLPARHVDSLLYNVPQNACSEAAVRGTRKLIHESCAKNVFGDSGGYQLLQKDLEGGVAVTYDPSKPISYGKFAVNINPELIIQANMKIKPQIMTSLDFPVPKISDPYLQYEEFMKKLGPNLVCMRETALLRKKYCPEIELYIPIQCYTLAQFEAYIEKPLMELEFDGLSLPTRNLGSGGVTLFLLKFYQMGIRKIHLLSVSSFTGLALAAYLARHIFDWCSTDATTWRFQAERQVYMDPNDFHGISVNSNAVFKEGERPVCDCPWCASGITFTGITNIPLTDRSSFLRCHNFYVVQKACTEFYENSVDLVTLERCLRKRSVRKKKKIDKLIQALSIATHMRDMDINVLEKMLWKI